MRVRRTLRPGTAWAAAAALIVAPLVVAPIVSAAEPGSEEASSSAPAAAALSAPAADQAPAEDAAPASSEAPAPAAQEDESSEQPASASVAAPSSQAPASQEAALSSRAAPSSAAPKAKSLTSAPAAQTLESSSSDAGISLLAASKDGGLTATAISVRSSATMDDGVGLAGVTLALRTSSSASFAGTVTTISTCVTASNGSCTLTIPASNFKTSGSWNGANYVKVVATSAPAGYSLVEEINATPNNISWNGTTGAGYGQLVRTSKLRAGTTVLLQNSLYNSESDASTGRIAVVKSNPASSQQCGIKLGLLLDRSGSIGSDGMDDLKLAADAMIDGLTGTPSQVGVWSFAKDAAENKTLTSVATATSAATVKSSYANFNANGGTNWDAGLWKVKTSASTPDVLIVISDGEPTYSLGPSGSGLTSQYGQGLLERAIWSANAVKNQGTKIITIGVGSNVKPGNLKLVSSSSDHYSVGSYSALKTALRELALAPCEGTVNVIKRVTTTGTTTEAASSAGVGFTFTKDGSTSKVTGETGGVSFPVNAAGTVKITESSTVGQQGYDIVPQKQSADGKYVPALCTSLSKAGVKSNVLVSAVSGDAYSFTVPADTVSTLTCTVYNKPKPKEASLTINHAWVDENNASLTDAQVAEVLNAPVNGAPSLKVNSGSVWANAPAYDDSVTTTTSGGSTKLVEGDGVTVAVRTAPGSVKSGYTCSSSLVSVTKGSSTNPTSLTSTLVAGNNAFTITHKLTCTTQLTLKKVVQAGPGDTTPASAWTLRSNGTAFTQGTAKAVTPGAGNVLTETGGPTAVPNKAWEQTNLVCDVAGTLNGTTVKVPRGKSVTCTFTNSSLQIEVSKRAWLGNTIPGSLSGDLPSGSAVADGSGISWLFTVKNTGFLDYRVSGISDNYVTTPITCAQSLTGTFKPFSSLTQSERTIANGSSLYCKATGTLAF
ncbi:VWA domain-containing protein [Galactobacter valiniphilus]|uniref:VWA domain-containing protein n=1 Tax=Galactobacter valiniphilus TaxID=2676122 RepID=UPI003736B641